MESDRAPELARSDAPGLTSETHFPSWHVLVRRWPPAAAAPLVATTIARHPRNVQNIGQANDFVL